MFGGDASCNPDFGGCGTVFRLSPNGALTTLHTFEMEDGLYPDGLTQATSGMFYGTTVYGGSSSNCTNGCGTAFSLDMGIGPFVTFVPAGATTGYVTVATPTGTLTSNVPFHVIP
jgi:hypothetical protein